MEWDLSALALKFLAAMVSSACNTVTLWIQFTRHQRCFAAEGVGDGVLGKRGESGHQCDVLTDW